MNREGLTRLQCHWLDSFQYQHLDNPVAVVGGDRKSGKSYLARKLALDVKAGSKVLMLVYNRRQAAEMLKELASEVPVDRIKLSTQEAIFGDGTYLKVAAGYGGLVRGMTVDTLICDNGVIPIPHYLRINETTRIYVFL